MGKNSSRFSRLGREQKQVFAWAIFWPPLKSSLIESQICCWGAAFRKLGYIEMGHIMQSFHTGLRVARRSSRGECQKWA